MRIGAVAEEAADERLVDDRDVLRPARVARVQVPAAHQLHAEVLEIGGADAIPRGAGRLAGLRRRLPRDQHALAPVVGERVVEGQPAAAHAGQPLHAILDVAIERIELLGPVVRRRPVQLHEHAARGREAEVLVLEVGQAAGQQQRPDDQHDRHRGLQHDQRLARERRMIAAAAAGAAQRVDRVGARREPGRRRPEEHAGGEGQREREGEHQRRGHRVDRQEGGAGKGQRQQQPGGADRDGQADDAAEHGQQHALEQRLRDDLPARGAERQPDRGLAATRDGAGQQQVGDVGAGDQQHQRAHAEQDAQAAAVLLAHDADAGAGRDHRDRLLRQVLDHAGHPVGRVAGIVLQPLPQDAGQPRAHAVRRRVRLQPADHAQPRRHRLAQQRRLAGDQRLLVQRDPQVRRIAAQRLAEEAGAGHADDGERVPLEDEGGADDLRIGAVGARPGVMAHDDDRRGRRGVVGRA